jgi:outer membrane protein OmpA-like peptidoglycan-associated protein
MYPKQCSFLNQKRFFVILVIFALIVLSFISSVHAQDQPDEDSEWRYSVSPYMWLLAMNGDITVEGIKADLDVDFNDIWDELNIGGMIEFEAWKKNRFGFFVNAMYSELGHSTNIGPLKVDPDIQGFWGETGVLYRLGTWDLSDAPGGNSPTVTLATGLGVRYTYLDFNLGFKNVPLPDLSGDKDWFEPILGLGTIWDLSDRWSLSVAGNIGGMAFGSDFAWGASGIIGYRFNLFGNDDARISLGYRVLSQDYDDGHGSNKFEWDVTLHGPVVGLTIPFGGKKTKAAEPARDNDGDGVYDHMDDCPGTPTGVTVDSNGCPLDSDRDGVADYMDKCPNTPADVKVNSSGCPLDSDGDGVYDYLDQCPDTPKGATVDEKGCWAFGGKVFFDFNKLEIKSDAQPLLKEAVNILEENPEMKVEIQGHTDSKGPEAYNQMLSEKRALAVTEYLLKQGIDSDRLETKGYGSSDPIASNDTEEGRQKNRRVRFKRIN